MVPRLPRRHKYVHFTCYPAAFKIVALLLVFHPPQKDQPLKANQLLKAHFKLKGTYKEAQIDDFKPFPKFTIQSSKPPTPFSFRSPVSPGSRVAEAALQREREWLKEERKRRKMMRRKMNDEAPSFLERMRNSIFGSVHNRSSKKVKQAQKLKGSSKTKASQKRKKNSGAYKRGHGNEKTEDTNWKSTEFKRKPESIQSAAASFKSRVASIRSRVESIKSKAASMKSTLRQKMDDVRARIRKKADADTTDGNESQYSEDDDHVMSGALESEDEDGRSEYQSEDDMVREADSERRKEQRKRRRRKVRRIRRRRRQVRRAKRRGTSESDSSENSEYYVSYGPVGRWGCIIM
ncbi:hypothetical protein V495_02752 [Pseudogymnoascus sp. VKM F-4514 (FW-929)]|nr:hypothetical protein V495_02752 [Pseudogymnoascus sp. VKM F-4514 (FW-929)]KFY59401.1 hypothetical protein V497_04313 [Pseudogymnoascus sp. VKM F-4516 (FW-969)]